MTRRKRRHFSSEDKLRILRLHLLEARPISDLCEEHDIHPTLFYQWQKSFFENGALALEGKRRALCADQQTIARLREKLRHKDEVLAEIAAEMVRLKKELGEDSP
jgi:transposase